MAETIGAFAAMRLGHTVDSLKRIFAGSKSTVFRGLQHWLARSVCQFQRSSICVLLICYQVAAEKSFIYSSRSSSVALSRATSDDAAMLAAIVVISTSPKIRPIDPRGNIKGGLSTNSGRSILTK